MTEKLSPEETNDLLRKLADPDRPFTAEEAARLFSGDDVVMTADVMMKASEQFLRRSKALRRRSDLYLHVFGSFVAVCYGVMAGIASNALARWSYIAMALFFVAIPFTLRFGTLRPLRTSPGASRIATTALVVLGLTAPLGLVGVLAGIPWMLSDALLSSAARFVFVVLWSASFLMRWSHVRTDD